MVKKGGLRSSRKYMIWLHRKCTVTMVSPPFDIRLSFEITPVAQRRAELLM
jgi:hypothetical protein